MKKTPSAAPQPELKRCRNAAHVVRWYVMVLPSCHRGPAVGLQAELDRRQRHHEPLFEYFAPRCVEVRKVKGQFVNTHKPLLYNYVFVRSSEAEIYRMKQRLGMYNFLPRVHEGTSGHYPYVTDAEMKNLQWVARAYSDVIPAYVPEPHQLVKGDRVRIIGGQFDGAEAHVVIQPGAGQKNIVVCVDRWMCVPLLHVTPDQYEIIALNEDGKHGYTRLDNGRIHQQLHEAMQRYHTPGGVSEADRRTAAEALRQYGGLQMTTDVMRCKHYALLIQSHLILGHREEAEKLMGIARTLEPLVKAEQARAHLLCILYGCTDSSIFYHAVHRLIAPWRQEAAPKKSKRQILAWVDDFDRWLGHE